MSHKRFLETVKGAIPVVVGENLLWETKESFKDMKVRFVSKYVMIMDEPFDSDKYKGGSIW